MKTRLGPAGIHLFDRVSGLNILLDEVVPPRSVWSQAPRHVSIALTNSCDLACKFCYAPKTRATLEFDTIASWLHELDSNGTIGIGFGGGEPTLYKRFAELCVYATAHTKLAVSFTSHGHHLTDELLSVLKGNVHFIRVSVDGVGATYERLRKRSFKALMQRLISIKKVVSFGINYVVNEDTMPDLNDAIRFAEDNGASEFLLLPERPVNGTGEIQPAAANALRAWIENYSGSIRLGISDYAAEQMPTCDPFCNERGLLAYAHVDAGGVLKRTSYDTSGVSIISSTFLASFRQLQEQNF